MENLIRLLLQEIVRRTTTNDDGSLKFNTLRFVRLLGILMPYERPDGTQYLRSLSDEEFDHINDNKGNYIYVRFTDEPQEVRKDKKFNIEYTPLRLVAVLNDCKNQMLAANLIKFLIIDTIGSSIEGDIVVQLNKQTNFTEETKQDLNRQKSETWIVSFDFTLASPVNNNCDLLLQQCACGEELTINICQR